MKNKLDMRIVLLACIMLILVACSSPPPETPVVFVIVTSTNTPIPTSTLTPTVTLTATPTATMTATATATHTPTLAPTDTKAPTPLPTHTNTPTLIPTGTRIPTITPGAINATVPITEPEIKQVNQAQSYGHLSNLAETDDSVVVVEGTADDEVELQFPNFGVIVVAVGNACYGDFNVVVSRLDETGEGDTIISSSIPYAGTTIYYSPVKDILLTVTADCTWGIAFSDLSEVSLSQIADNRDIIVGSGNAVIGFKGANAQQITADYTGNSTFALTAWGNEQQLAFMEEGSFSGTVESVDGLYLLEVVTVGNWQIVVE